MIDRRNFIALATAVPLLSPSPRLDLPDLRVDALRTEDVTVLGISPDGSTLVGIANRDRICFLDADTRWETSVSDPLDEIGSIAWTSLTWSPDGSRIAFSLDAWLLMVDSDIYVADAATGEVTNLTAEGNEDESVSLMEAPDVQIDMHPIWVDEETLIFARHDGLQSEPGSPQTSLVTMSPDSTEINTWAELPPADIRYVIGPMKLISDERIVLVTDDENNQIGLFIADKDGIIEKIDTGDILFFQLLDANDTHCLLHDAEASTTWLVPYDDPGSMKEINDIFELESGEAFASFPALGPTLDSIVVALANENRSVVVYEEGETREVAYLRGPESSIRQCRWVQDRILIAGDEASWLISLD